jgi:uncharacterized protein YbcI
MEESQNTTPAEDLLRAGGDSSAAPGQGSTRAALATAMVGLKKEYFGRGPTAAKAWILDDYVFVALEGGLTRSEETLLEAGKEDLIRNFRLAFQEAMSEKTMGAVGEITGRRVMTYHSQIVFRPMRSFEIFVLEPPSSEIDSTASGPTASG